MIENAVVFDTETTGIDPRTARIVQAALLEYKNGHCVSSLELSLVDPECEIPGEATAVHGISTELASKGMSRDSCAILLNQFLHNAVTARIPVVVMNAPYDLRIVANEIRCFCAYYLGNSPKWFEKLTVLDPLALDRHFRPTIRGKGRRTLSALFQEYVGCPFDDAHNAYCDSLATWEVLYGMWHRYPILGEMDMPELMNLQRNAHVAWAEWFNRVQTETIVELTWPM